MVVFVASSFLSGWLVDRSKMNHGAIEYQWWYVMICDDILLVSKNPIAKKQIQVIFAAQKFVYSIGCPTCMAKFDSKSMLPVDTVDIEQDGTSGEVFGTFHDVHWRLYFREDRRRDQCVQRPNTIKYQMQNRFRIYCCFSMFFLLIARRPAMQQQDPVRWTSHIDKEKHRL